MELPRLRKDKQKDTGPVQCHITGTLSDPKIAVQGASLVVNLTGGDKPALTVGNVNLNFSVEDTKDGRMLTLAPVTLFDKQKLTPEVGDELLHLVAPTLGDLTGVQGEILAVAGYIPRSPGRSGKRVRQESRAGRQAPVASNLRFREGAGP